MQRKDLNSATQILEVWQKGHYMWGIHSQQHLTIQSVYHMTQSTRKWWQKDQVEEYKPMSVNTNNRKKEDTVTTFSRRLIQLQYHFIHSCTHKCSTLLSTCSSRPWNITINYTSQLTCYSNLGCNAFFFYTYNATGKACYYCTLLLDTIIHTRLFFHCDRTGLFNCCFSW